MDSLSRFLSAVEDCDMGELPTDRVLRFYCRAADDGREEAYAEMKEMAIIAQRNPEPTS